MRKYLFVCTFVVLAALTIAPVAAQYQGPGDAPGVPTNITFTPVSQANNLPDDSILAMRGFLIQKVDDDEYRFADESDPGGTDPNNVIKVEMEGDVFRGQAVTPETKIAVAGKVDKKGGGNEIDVYYLVVIPTQ
jgi:uncharacterized protein (TIGR00156 family)